MSGEWFGLVSGVLGVDLRGEAADARLDGRVDVRLARLLHRVDDLLAQLGVVGPLRLRTLLGLGLGLGLG